MDRNRVSNRIISAAKSTPAEQQYGLFASTDFSQFNTSATVNRSLAQSSSLGSGINRNTLQPSAVRSGIRVPSTQVDLHHVATINSSRKVGLGNIDHTVSRDYVEHSSMDKM